MSSYYYLISSLPMLRSDGAMPISYERFLSWCEGSVSGEKLERLKTLTADSSKGPLLREWAAFYGVLSKELTYQRSVKLGRPAEPPAERDSDAVRVVNAALNAKNPLEAENMLLALEFDKLDSLLSMHYFDDYVLNGYALKLRLLERKCAFEKERGRKEFKRLFDGIQQQVFSI